MARRVLRLIVLNLAALLLVDSPRAQAPHVVPGNASARPLVDATPKLRDPDTEKIAATMVLVTNALEKLFRQYDAQSLLKVYHVLERPSIKDDPKKVYSHILVPLPKVAFSEGELPPSIGTCDIGGGMGIAGARFIATPGITTLVEIEALGKSDPYLVEACSALSRSDRRTVEHLDETSRPTGLGFSLPISIFILERESASGPSYEDRTLGLFWDGAFSEGLPSDPVLLTLLKFGDNLVPILLQAAQGSGKLSFRISARSLGIDDVVAVDRASPTYRDQVKRVDERWSNYLMGVRVSGRGARRRMVDKGKVKPLFRRFSVSEVGSEEFWNSSYTSRHYEHKVMCLGVIFAIDQHYATAQEMDGYRDCVTSFTSQPTLP